MAIKNKWEISKLDEDKNKSIAVVGGGPAGITAAAYLARKGFKVTIYEKHVELGGLLSHGIPDFRLPRDIIKEAVRKVLNLGVKVEYEKELGKNLTLEELQDKYDAILLAFGANISLKMNIEGESLEGVYGGNELLESENYPNFEGKTVCVVGRRKYSYGHCTNNK